MHGQGITWVKIVGAKNCDRLELRTHGGHYLNSLTIHINGLRSQFRFGHVRSFIESFLLLPAKQLQNISDDILHKTSLFFECASSIKQLASFSTAGFGRAKISPSDPSLHHLVALRGPHGTSAPHSCAALSIGETFTATWGEANWLRIVTQVSARIS